MGKTYNGRFYSPPEPPSGNKWLIPGLVMIPLWSIPLIGVPIMAGSIFCFVKAGKMDAERRMYKRFHEFSAVIGMRQRVPVKELAKTAEMGRGEMRKYLQQMIAKGYFGQDAYLDVPNEELVLPPMKGEPVEAPRAGWKDVVFDVMDILRGNRPAYEPAQSRQQEPVSPKRESKAETVADEKPEIREEAPVQKPQAEKKPGKKNYMDELEKTLNELYQLNEQIEDEAVSRRIDRIGALTAGIFRAVIDNPEREQDVRKFMNYYLPTTLKLLKSYDMLEDQSYQGENIVASRKKIENVLDMLIEAYEKQLDRLFSNDALDIAADVDVLEAMIAGDGLTDKGQLKMM